MTGYRRPPAGQYRATIVVTGDDLGEQHMQWLIINLLGQLGFTAYVEDIAKLPDTGPGPRHLPRRGSDVEAWIKRHRDTHSAMTAEEAEQYGEHAQPREWHILDALLDDYRERADIGEDLTTTTGDDGA